MEKPGWGNVVASAGQLLTIDSFRSGQPLLSRLSNQDEHYEWSAAVVTGLWHVVIEDVQRRPEPRQVNIEVQLQPERRDLGTRLVSDRR